MNFCHMARNSSQEPCECARRRVALAVVGVLAGSMRRCGSRAPWQGARCCYETHGKCCGSKTHVAVKTDVRRLTHDTGHLAPSKVLGTGRVAFC